MKVSREKFEECRDNEDHGRLAEITLVFENGKEYTLKACDKDTHEADGLFVFIEQDDGVIVVGGGSNFLVSFIKDVVLDSMFKGVGRVEQERKLS